MRLSLTKPETSLLLACAVLLLAALFGPHMAQPAHYHAFADQRALWGIPCALDVLSNIPFAMAGALGLFYLARVPREALEPAQRFCAGLFFAGLLATAAGSSWYHLAPDDAGLAIDRATMSMAFAGLLGLLVATRVSARSGRVVALGLLVLAPLAVFAWLRTGNVLPWVLVQGGGVVLILALPLVLPLRTGALPVAWIPVLVAYAVAKLFEVYDPAVFAATGELLAGHTVKHVIAAFAAWPVIAAVVARAARQNGRQEHAAHVA